MCIMDFVNDMQKRHALLFSSKPIVVKQTNLKRLIKVGSSPGKVV